jgi:hypothetical protein
MGWIKTLNVDLYTTGSTVIAVGYLCRSATCRVGYQLGLSQARGSDRPWGELS